MTKKSVNFSTLQSAGKLFKLYCKGLFLVLAFGVGWCSSITYSASTSPSPSGVQNIRWGQLPVGSYCGYYTYAASPRAEADCYMSWFNSANAIINWSIRLNAIENISSTSATLVYDVKQDSQPWYNRYSSQKLVAVAFCGDVKGVCQPGATYNPSTGEYAYDQQKGDPGICPASLVHDPINAAVGNSFQTEVDYPGSGVSTLHFTRVYNSLDGLWRHNHSTYLRLLGNNISLVMADGRESFFTISGSTVTASPTELGLLIKTASGWLYTAKNNDTYTFDAFGATGRLTRWANAAGAQHFLTYANGKVTVTDNLGKTLSFTEDAQHQPLTLSTAGLTIKYDYNTNTRLSKLTRTRGWQTEQRLFHYEKADKPNLLTGITDERGVRYTTWTFDDQDRATSSENAGGVKHGEVAYNTDGSSTITNEFGKKSIYRFVTIDGVKRVSAIEGEALGSCPMSNSTFTYDSRGLLKTKTDNKGNVTTFEYNERGLEASRTEAFGTPEARTVTTEWHPTLFLPVTVSEPARITTYAYDAQGRPTGQTVSER